MIENGGIVVGQIRVRRSTRRPIPVEEYLGCVDEAWIMVQDDGVPDLESVDQALKLVEKSRRDEGLLSTDLVEDSEDAGNHGHNAQRQSSAGDHLRLALLKFCGRHGFEKDGWAIASHP